MNQTNNELPPAVIIFIISVIAFLAFGCNTNSSAQRVLVFSKTAGFRHSSIEDGKAMFMKLGPEKGFQVDTTEDASVFTEDQLKAYNLVVFLSTTGDILDRLQQNELERYMKAGGNWMGIHAAADAEYDWPWYNELCGAYFLDHPKRQTATIQVVDPQHQSAAHLGSQWTRFDEWYNYKSIKSGLNPVLRVDESSYEGGKNGDNHMIAWYRNFENGRSFYTGVGHTKESYTDPIFIQHIWGGVQYSLGNGKAVDYAQVGKVPEGNRFEVETFVAGM